MAAGLGTFLCSTPFGITDYCAMDALGYKIAHGSAQRLSASQIIALVTPPTVDEDVLCSTPFGITDYCAYQMALDKYMPALCSTPFGITDYCARGAVSADDLGQMCSTPFGITDYCAWHKQ